jgi:hypothetical protein
VVLVLLCFAVGLKMSASRTAATKNAATKSAAKSDGLVDCTSDLIKEKVLDFMEEEAKMKKKLKKKRRSKTCVSPLATRKRRLNPTPPNSWSKKAHAAKTTCASSSYEDYLLEKLMLEEDGVEEVPAER